MSQDIKDLVVEASTIPKCPACGKIEWRVRQKIGRESNLIRVDGLRDLVVHRPDEGTYEQALLMECLGCGAEYFPQAEVKASEELNQPEKIEAWSLDTGLYDWPRVVTNEVSYE